MALIMLPSNFYRQFLESPVYQMGAIAFVGCQPLELCKYITDCSWAVFDDLVSEQIKQEALREEGRFLRLYSKQHPAFEPNKYQQQLIDDYNSADKS
jgi:hypothetical protein